MLPKKESAFIIKKNGEKVGPYEATFSGNTVFINDSQANVSDGDQVMRVLPNGAEELKFVKNCHFYNSGVDGRGPHYQLKISPIPVEDTYTTNQTINIHGESKNIQIGNHNHIEFREEIQKVIEMIDKSVSTQEQKDEARGLLNKFLQHPLVTTLAGSAISSLLSGK